jgi:hypothetical protein
VRSPQILRGPLCSTTVDTFAPSRPNPDTPLRTAAVENMLSDSDPSGGRKAHAQLHALPSTAASTLASLSGGHQFHYARSECPWTS